VPRLAAMYECSSGRTLHDWHEHLALAYFKAAVIFAGIAHRHRKGAGIGAGYETARQAVEPYLRLALAELQRD
jgi:aminoglycoside phosphotransferase (APT) family kinase protein